VAAHRHYVCMFKNGFRKSTVVRMTPKWVNFPTGLVVIPKCSYKVKRKDVKIVLHPDSPAAIKEQLRQDGRLIEAVEGKGAVVKVLREDEPIFGWFDHKTLFAATMKRLGIDAKAIGLTAHHGARHTMAQILADSGASDRQLMAAGGWSSPQIISRYANETEELSRQAMALMP